MCFPLQHYVENFEEHGYTNKHFISSMDSEVYILLPE